MSSNLSWYLTIFLVAYAPPSWSQQQRHTVSGYVYDAASGELLTKATVLSIKTARGTATDEYGRFVLIVEADSVHLRFSYLGYIEEYLRLVLRADTLVRVGLARSPVELEEVSVAADHAVTSLSQIQLTPREIDRMPAMAGETDVVKALQLLPGVQGGREGAAGLYVRGGSPDQNLVLLDGTPIYNANHLLGFLSTFNPDVIRSVNLSRGAGSARYGGRLSSVLDVAMKEGNLYERQTYATIGIVAARVTTEGPIRRGRAAYLFSARRTYLDALWRIAQPSDEKFGYYFFDLVGKVNWVGSRQRVYLSLYGGQDRFWLRYDENESSYSEQYEGALFWGNLTGSLRWQSQLSPRLLASASLSRTSYTVAFDEKSRYRAGREQDETYNGTTYRSGVADWTAKADLDLRVGFGHRIRVGGNATLHTYTPSTARVSSQDRPADSVSTRVVGSESRLLAWETAVYAEDEIVLGRRVLAVLGLRGSAFMVADASYAALEPRLVLRYTLNANTSIEASFAEARQYTHLVSRSGIGIPLDLWLPTTDAIGPQQARQVSLGATRKLQSQAAVEVSAEVYLKKMTGVLTPIEGSSLLGIDATGWERRVEVGHGKAYGLETLVRKREGRLTGWVAYTLARSTRRFDGIDDGKQFPYQYDRRHDLALTASYQLTKRWALSGTWVYASGNAAWLPVARAPDVEDFAGYRYYSNDPELSAYVYGARNGWREPAYHRLDFAARRTNELRRGTRTWTMGLYNVYAQRNPFYLYAKTRDDGRLTFRKVSPFILIPAFSYAITF